MIIQLHEKINREKLAKVLNCSNIPIDNEEDDDDIRWFNNFKMILKNYSESVIYTQKNDKGRYYCNGLQGFPRDIRKYVSDNIYVDIDIVNCHPVLIENILKMNDITVPLFLKEYNSDRNGTICKYHLNDKLDILKIINNEICYKKYQIINDFHKVLYSDLIEIFKRDYKIKEREKNVLGSYMAHCLHDIENKVLMCMFNKCNEMKVKIGVLVFDGMMIYKSSYNENLLNILEKEIEEKLNYKIKIIEKSMETDWEPIKDEKCETVLYKSTLDLVPGKFFEINDNINIKSLINMAYPINNNDFMDYMHKSYDKNCKEQLYYNVILNEAAKSIICNVSCKKCKQIHPKNNDVCENNNIDMYELIKSNIEMYVTENNITFNVVNNYNNTEELEEIEDMLIFDDTVSGNEKIDEWLKQLIFKNLDSDYCNIIHELYKEKLKTCNGIWYVFQNPIWKKLDKNPIEINNGMKQIIDYLKIIMENNKKQKLIYRKDIKKHIHAIERRLSKNNEETNFSKALIKYFNDDSFIENLDKNKLLIAFDNGVYDLSNENFRDGVAEDNLSMKLNYDYNFVDKSNEKIKFLEKMLNDILDKEQKEYLLKAIASCLEGSNSECKFFINTGKGRNGKSLLFDFLSSVLQPYQVTMEPSFITKEREKANESNEALMMTNKKRLILISEPNKRDIIRSDIMKKYTGDKKTLGRGNYGKSVEIEIGFKMFLLCNSIPLLDKCENAEYERLAVIKFENHFVDNPKKKNEKLINRNLLSILDLYKNEMMNILLKYYRMYKKEKLIMPQKIINNTKIYKDKIKNSDDIYVFIQEKLQVCENNRVKCREIWETYTNWCNDNNKKKGKQSELEDAIEVEFDVERIYKSNSYVYQNIKIKDDILIDD